MATIRDIDGLIEAGLVDAPARTAVAAVVDRYAVAITPAMRDAIGGFAEDEIVGDFGVLMVWSGSPILPPIYERITFLHLTTTELPRKSIN